MNPEIKAKWLERLNDPSIKQGRMTLKSTTVAGEDIFCCLGVLCEIAVEEGIIEPPTPRHGIGDSVSMWCYGDGDDVLTMGAGIPPTKVMNWAGLDNLHAGPRHLPSMNDSGTPFVIIAQYIKEYL
jgi:hypothetical protein